jgi:hypothetical protein
VVGGTGGHKQCKQAFRHEGGARAALCDLSRRQRGARGWGVRNAKARRPPARHAKHPPRITERADPDRKRPFDAGGGANGKAAEQDGRGNGTTQNTQKNSPWGKMRARGLVRVPAIGCLSECDRLRMACKRAEWLRSKQTRPFQCRVWVWFFEARTFPPSCPATPSQSMRIQNRRVQACVQHAPWRIAECVL